MTKIQGVFFDLGWTLEKPHSGDWMFTDYFWMCMPSGLKPLYRTEKWQKAEDNAAEAAFKDAGKILTMAHTSWNRAGRRSVPPARATVTSPSSRGWRMFSIDRD